MSAVPSAKHYEILSPVRRSTPRAFRLAGREGEWFAGEQPSRGRRSPRLNFLMMFFLGAVAVLAWQSYSRAAREIIAGLSPQLRWLAPPAVVADGPDRIDQLAHSVDRIASDIAASREQVTRSIGDLAAGQEEMTLQIIKLRAITQFAPPRKEEPPAQPAARKANQRPLRAAERALHRP